MTNSRTILTPEQAIEIRCRVRKVTYGSLDQLGKEFGVHGQTVMAVIRGRSFKHINRIEPPIDFALVNPNRVKRESSPTDKYLDKLIKMRKSNPKKWTFKALAEFMQKDSSFKLSKFNLSEVMVKRDSSLSKKRPKSPPKPKMYNRECAYCEKPFQSKTRTTEVCFDEECRQLLEDELAYERSMR